MSVFGQTVNIFLLFALALLTWVLPRRFGLLGMFGAQLLVAPGFLLMGFIALATGVWERHEDGLVIVGLLLQALFVNCLLFPVALVATLRHRRVASRAERGLCPGCGYDLRATPGRCPECGLSPPLRRRRLDGPPGHGLASPPRPAGPSRTTIPSPAPRTPPSNSPHRFPLRAVANPKIFSEAFLGNSRIPQDALRTRCAIRAARGVIKEGQRYADARDDDDDDAD